MHTVFMEDHSTLMLRLNMLECSTVVGHDVAVFVLSLVLHRSNSGVGNDNIARWWLRNVEACLYLHKSLNLKCMLVWCMLVIEVE